LTPSKWYWPPTPKFQLSPSSDAEAPSAEAFRLVLP
jgi:hypothetical protein